MGQSNYWLAWQDLLGSVHTGETAFQRVHGTSVWDYRAHHSCEAETFDRAMGTVTEKITEAVQRLRDHCGCRRRRGSISRRDPVVLIAMEALIVLLGPAGVLILLGQASENA
jgi:hypothetical protein